MESVNAGGTLKVDADAAVGGTGTTTVKGTLNYMAHLYAIRNFSANFEGKSATLVVNGTKMLGATNSDFALQEGAELTLASSGGVTRYTLKSGKVHVGKTFGFTGDAFGVNHFVLKNGTELHIPSGITFTMTGIASITGEGKLTGSSSASILILEGESTAVGTTAGTYTWSADKWVKNGGG